jgi:two-component system, LuxR family, response regulator FixJ
MTRHFPFHVIDSDCNRRATIARAFYARHLHAEIYQNVAELISRAPQEGAVLIADDEATDEDNSIDVMTSGSGYLPVAYFSASPSPQMVVRAMRSGALDYLQWPFSSEALEATIARLQQRGRQGTVIQRRQADARHLIETLTPRQRDVLEGIVAGESNKQNAIRLGISHRTVEIHRGEMMTRLMARSVSDAVRIAVYAGFGGS